MVMNEVGTSIEEAISEAANRKLKLEKELLEIMKEEEQLKRRRDSVYKSLERYEGYLIQLNYSDKMKS
jgi:predicted  nucleic acid-binding Zn-ribbon protein